MTTRITNVAALAACNAVVDLLDAGSGPGKIRIYSGSVPATADASIGAAVLLAELPLADPAFGAAADTNPGARATANAISPVQAVADGTATFFRALDSDNNPVIQGNVGAELTLNTTDIVEDVDVEITSWTHDQPEA